MSKKGYSICGIFFEQSLFNNLLIKFKEGFSYASLSIENSFNELKDLESQINKLKSASTFEYYKLLNKKQRKIIDENIRKYIVYYGFKYGIIYGKFDYNLDKKQIDNYFNKNFAYMNKDAHYFIKFDCEGNFSEKDTLNKLLHSIQNFHLRQLLF